MSHASHYARQYVEGKLPQKSFRAIFGDDAFKKLNKEQINLLKNADKIAKNEQPRLESGTAQPSRLHHGERSREIEGRKECPSVNTADSMGVLAGFRVLQANRKPSTNLKAHTGRHNVYP